MTEKYGRYFIAIIPAEPWYSEALQLKKEVRDVYESKGALRSPPHITLHMPFRWTLKKTEILKKTLSEIAASLPTFQVSFDGFGSFEPKVLFIRVRPDPDLIEFQKKLVTRIRLQLNVFNADYRDLPFRPHLTIGFRDLSPKNFELAWQKFQHEKFEGNFTVQAITLLKSTDAGWVNDTNFELQEINKP
ncbi:MAG: 2'-5' RNA ligase family protein [Bacteroidetes bacterium]|nr:2'-5' RNA ligase family protein [Bacteroidota bacterium]